MPYVQQGFDFVRFGTQVAQQFQRPSGGRAPGPAAPSAAPQPAAYAAPQEPGADAGSVPAAAGQLDALLQALAQRQVPPLPPPQPVSPAIDPSAQPDGTALLALILANPQFQRALQQAAQAHPAAPRTVALAVPAPAPYPHARPVDVPLGAVINAIAALSGRAMTELNARTSEEDPVVPAYLVDEEGEFLVDPASPDDRAALVAHLFRLDAHAGGLGLESADAWPEHDNDLATSEAWAVEAGFTR